MMAEKEGTRKNVAVEAAMAAARRAKEQRQASEGAEAGQHAETDRRGLLDKLRQLVGVNGPSADGAIVLLSTGEGATLRDLLVASLLGSGSQLSLLSELEALTAVVRLLAVGTGDPNGDTATRDLLDPKAADVEQSSLALASHVQVVEALRSQTMLQAILDVLARHDEDFKRGDSVYLHWEALKALRLVMSIDGLLHVGVSLSEVSSLWPAEEHGSLRNGEAQRRVVEVLLHQLRLVGETMGQKPKINVLGSLWCLAATSAYIRTRILQAGGEDLVASIFRNQVRKPGLFVEAALVVECGVLTALAGGARVHERNLAKLGVDQDVVEMLKKFGDYRQVACAGLLLLALLANDEAVAARLAASTEALEAISAARKRWAEEIEKTFKNNVHYVSPTASVLIKGSPPASARHQELPRPAQARNRSSRNRSLRSAGACVVRRVGA